MADAVVAEPSREVPDEVVDQILLRLPSPSSLVRAAAAYFTFRRLVSSPSFLRRHRALHPDPGFLLGFFSASAHGSSVHPADPPGPSASVARAVAGAADFSFAFLPGTDDADAPRWIVRDHRDGRFLLDRAASPLSIVSVDLAVCDPLPRRYVLFPPIPGELRAAVKDDPLAVLVGHRLCEPFLGPAPAPEEEHQPSFTVFWMARCVQKVVMLAFSSRGGGWREIPLPASPYPGPVPVVAVWKWRHYAHGRFYWVDCHTDRWLVLDMCAMELAVKVISSPIKFWEEQVAVVEGADGKVGVFAHDYRTERNATLYYYTIARGGNGTQRWQLERTVQLPSPMVEGGGYTPRAAANGCLIIEVVQDNMWMRCFFPNERIRDVQLFKIDVRSFQLESVCLARYAAGDCCWPCFGFPPLLSFPTV